VVVALVAGLSLAAVATYLVRAKKPSEATVEARLRDALPRGFILFEVTSYDRQTGWLKFLVTYRDDDPMGVVYTVERTREYGGGTYDRPVWNVRVTCRRCGPDGLTFLDAEFDPHGEMRRKQPLSAPGRALEQLYEDQARGIARAVFQVF
jgi:hypothetical protein